MRGYLRTEGTRKRLRFVAPGYAAENPNVPFNMVRFDSDSYGMASFLESGEAIIPQGSSNFVALTEGMTIRSWSYGFVPLCLFYFYAFNTTGWTTTARALTSAGSTGTRLGEPQIRVSTSGIWVRGAFDKQSGVDFRVRWIALRIPAT